MSIFGKKTVASVVAPLKGIVDSLRKLADDLNQDSVNKLRQIETLRQAVGNNGEEESRALSTAQKIAALLGE